MEKRGGHTNSYRRHERKLPNQGYEHFPLTKENRMIYRAKCSAGDQFVPPVADLSHFSQESRAWEKKPPQF